MLIIIYHLYILNEFLRRHLLNLPNEFLKHSFLIQMVVVSVEPSRSFLALHHWTNPSKEDSWYPLVVLLSWESLILNSLQMNSAVSAYSFWTVGAMGPSVWLVTLAQGFVGLIVERLRLIFFFFVHQLRAWWRVSTAGTLAIISDCMLR